MPEGVESYPRWNGQLAPTANVAAVVEDAWTRLVRSMWGQVSLVLVFGFAILTAGGLYTASQGQAGGTHTMSGFVDYLTLAIWGGVLLAIVAGGPSLAADRDAGALELYFTRGLTRTRYLASKSIAVFAAAFVGIFGPGFIYWGTSWFIFENHPHGWGWAILGLGALSAIGAVVISSLAMGVSAAASSSRGSVLTLLGIFATLDILVGDILMLLTDSATLEVGSPISALAQQATWLFPVQAPFDFPTWWGAVTLAATVVVGLALLGWNPPRVRGEPGAR